HEIYAEAEEYVQKQSALLGMKYLRNESVTLRFGGSSMQLAGVDYQRRGERYLPGTEHLQEAGYYNVLLSHNPDVFPVAAKQGWDLTIGGHTHGGQIQMEFLHPSLNVARFYTPFTYGLYEQNGKRLYVSRGVGTIGVPLRLGAPPEVVCLRLCAT
ncbi:MAG TPA: hypothetical protein VES20_01010, partial [Bryobacteraceae bacterium]|nr:hypothetical protein [Bryobacteraceae bacterium]